MNNITAVADNDIEPGDRVEVTGVAVNGVQEGDVVAVELHARTVDANE